MTESPLNAGLLRQHNLLDVGGFNADPFFPLALLYEAMHGEEPELVIEERHDRKVEDLVRYFELETQGLQEYNRLYLLLRDLSCFYLLDIHRCRQEREGELAEAPFRAEVAIKDALVDRRLMRTIALVVLERKPELYATGRQYSATMSLWDLGTERSITNYDGAVLFNKMVARLFWTKPEAEEADWSD